MYCATIAILQRRAASRSPLESGKSWITRQFILSLTGLSLALNKYSTVRATPEISAPSNRGKDNDQHAIAGLSAKLLPCFRR